MAGDIGNMAIPISGAIALLVTIVGGAWKFANDLRSESEKIVKFLTDAEKRIDDRSATQRRELVDLIDQAERRFGETVAAAKEHSSKIQLDLIRDYVTKREFESVFISIRTDIRDLTDRIDDGFIRMNDKLDRAAEWRSHVYKGEPPE